MAYFSSLTEYDLPTLPADTRISYSTFNQNNTCYIGDDIYIFYNIETVDISTIKSSLLYITSDGETYNNVAIDIGVTDYTGCHIYSNSQDDLYFFYKYNGNYYYAIYTGTWATPVLIDTTIAGKLSLNNLQISFDSSDIVHSIIEVVKITDIYLYYSDNLGSTWEELTGTVNVTDSLIVSQADGSCMIVADLDIGGSATPTANTYYFKENISTGTWTGWDDIMGSVRNLYNAVMFIDKDDMITFITQTFYNNYSSVYASSWLSDKYGVLDAGVIESYVWDVGESIESVSSAIISNYRPKIFKSKDNYRHQYLYEIYDNSNKMFVVKHREIVGSKIWRDFVNLPDFPKYISDRVHEVNQTLTIDDDYYQYKFPKEHNDCDIIATTPLYSTINNNIVFTYDVNGTYGSSSYLYLESSSFFDDSHNNYWIYDAWFDYKYTGYMQLNDYISVGTTPLLEFDTKYTIDDTDVSFDIKVAEYSATPTNIWQSANYDDLTAAMTLLNQINIPVSSSNPKLKLDAKINTEEDYDYLFIDISINNGANWTNLATFTGDYSSWTEYTYDLSSYKNNNILIRFKYETDTSYTMDGVQLKDIILYDDSTTFFSDTFNVADWTIDEFTIEQDYTWTILETLQGEQTTFANKQYNLTGFENKNIILRFQVNNVNYYNYQKVIIKNIKVLNNTTEIYVDDYTGYTTSIFEVSNEIIADWIIKKSSYPTIGNTYSTVTYNMPYTALTTIYYRFRYYSNSETPTDIFMKNLTINNSSEINIVEDCDTFERWINAYVESEHQYSYELRITETLPMFIIEPTALSSVYCGINIDTNDVGLYDRLAYTKSLPEENVNNETEMLVVTRDILGKPIDYTVSVGNIWITDVIQGTNGVIYCIYYIDYGYAISGWIGGFGLLTRKYYIIVKSEDGGLTWDSIGLPHSSYTMLDPTRPIIFGTHDSHSVDMYPARVSGTVDENNDLHVYLTLAAKNPDGDATTETCGCYMKYENNEWVKSDFNYRDLQDSEDFSPFIPDDGSAQLNTFVFINNTDVHIFKDDGYENMSHIMHTGSLSGITNENWTTVEVFSPIIGSSIRFYVVDSITNNKFYLLSVDTNSPVCAYQFKIFDKETNTWTDGASPYVEPNYYYSNYLCTLYESNGKVGFIIYLMDGNYSNSRYAFNRYDEDTDTWTYEEVFYANMTNYQAGYGNPSLTHNYSFNTGDSSIIVGTGVKINTTYPFKAVYTFLRSDDDGDTWYLVYTTEKNMGNNSTYNFQSLSCPYDYDDTQDLYSMVHLYELREDVYLSCCNAKGYTLPASSCPMFYYDNGWIRVRRLKKYQSGQWT